LNVYPDVGYKNSRATNSNVKKAEKTSGVYPVQERRKIVMNPQMQFTKPLENPEIVTTDTDTLVESGFTPEEVVSMLYLRQWYQTGGSDRVEVIRHLEFLKLMVMSGKIEL